jgi:hypothetical protein
MKARNEIKSVIITFSEEEALVLFEWLHNFNKVERPTMFEDHAEERILFDIEAELEKVILSTFDSNYHEILLKARQKIKGDTVRHI